MKLAALILSFPILAGAAGDDAVASHQRVFDGLAADPCTRAAIAAEPAPAIALKRFAIGHELVADGAGAHRNETARSAAAGADQCCIAVGNDGR